jgi:hypothetical protein
MCWANDPLADLVRWAQVAPPRSWAQLPVGANFRLGLKKIPPFASTPKHMEGPAGSRPALTRGNGTGNGTPCVRVGVRGFSRSALEDLLLILILGGWLALCRLSFDIGRAGCRLAYWSLFFLIYSAVG